MVGATGVGMRDSLRSMLNTLKLSRKSDREEFLLYLKLVFIGLGIVGSIGFIIQLIASFVRLPGG